jgi:hypothetical protein
MRCPKTSVSDQINSRNFGVPNLTFTDNAGDGFLGGLSKQSGLEKQIPSANQLVLGTPKPLRTKSVMSLRD